MTHSALCIMMLCTWTEINRSIQSLFICVLPNLKQLFTGQFRSILSLLFFWNCQIYSSYTVIICLNWGWLSSECLQTTTFGHFRKTTHIIGVCVCVSLLRDFFNLPVTHNQLCIFRKLATFVEHLFKEDLLHLNWNCLHTNCHNSNWNEIRLDCTSRPH